eukprot:CAMPEP_0119129346 /NCGR_PEP_ID=MMETSP1310-20130426/7131_1 /TAXON_ID=464262 /ORGANISM="Genus nov. species nov., Strain RCC2339" /LENGTH=722 /DNA_ID=CAMNT_0007119765 /DNA_START=99 /DNA_END=2264 /DNA_ORIENTATION=+
MSKKGKIVIKPFRNQAQMDRNYAENTWSLLKNAIHEIHRQNASGLSFEELYRNAYNMVLHKYGDLLYEGLRDVVDEHLKEVMKMVALSPDAEFLDQLAEAWNSHKISMLMIRDILMYMDRVYVHNHNRPQVFDLGLNLFKENIVRAPEIKERLLNILLEMVHCERNGEIINQRLFKDLTGMLVNLGVNSRVVYEEDFEAHFLQKTAEFYNIEAQKYLSFNSCAEYLRKVEQRLEEENKRVDHYLDPDTKPKLRETLERTLIDAHIETLIEMEGSGLVPMLKEDKVEDLFRMYSLFERSEMGLDMVLDVFGKYVRHSGKLIVTDAEKVKDPNLFVQALIDLRKKYMFILEKSFHRDKRFSKELNQAFEHLVLLNPRSPEFISLFIDGKLRRSQNRAVNDKELETYMEQVIDIFHYIQEKDIFEKYYKQHLAKRLLLGKSDAPAERSMIQKLKVECGYQFTSKLEGMFNDIDVSSENMEDFRNFLKGSENPLKGTELNVQILTTGFWPTQSTEFCRLPLEAQRCCAVFEKFYISKFDERRRLTWQYNMGTADLKVMFSSRREINVSTYQMVILMLFRTCGTLSFEDIKSQTEIPMLDLKRNLLMMTLGKHKILLKEPRTRKIEENAIFHFNHGFRTNLYRIKIVQALSKGDTSQQQGVVMKRIEEDRKNQIEAAIVRIMKARKRMEHTNLIMEVSRQLSARFHPNPVLIKRRIESLLEREYMER